MHRIRLITFGLILVMVACWPGQAQKGEGANELGLGVKNGKERMSGRKMGGGGPKRGKKSGETASGNMVGEGPDPSKNVSGGPEPNKKNEGSGSGKNMSGGSGSGKNMKGGPEAGKKMGGMPGSGKKMKEGLESGKIISERSELDMLRNEGPAPIKKREASESGNNMNGGPGSNKKTEGAGSGNNMSGGPELPPGAGKKGVIDDEQPVVPSPEASKITTPPPLPSQLALGARHKYELEFDGTLCKGRMLMRKGTPIMPSEPSPPANENNSSTASNNTQTADATNDKLVSGTFGNGNEQTKTFNGDLTITLPIIEARGEYSEDNDHVFQELLTNQTAASIGQPWSDTTKKQ